MHDGDARVLHAANKVLGAVARRFHDLHAAVDDDLQVLAVGRRIDRGQDGEVHTKGPVGQGAGAGNLVRQRLRRGLGEGREHAQSPCVGHGRDQLGLAHPLHAALNDGVADAQQFGDACFHATFSSG